MPLTDDRRYDASGYSVYDSPDIPPQTMPLTDDRRYDASDISQQITPPPDDPGNDSPDISQQITPPPDDPGNDSPDISQQITPPPDDPGNDSPDISQQITPPPDDPGNDSPDKQKIMILGDFNADGRYLSKKKKEKIRICSAHYHWLIEDDVDTTSSNFNDHTYDRIVVYGQTMLNAIVPGSAKSFNFQREFKLTDEETLSISDHYPVEVELKTDQKHKAPTRRRMSLPQAERTTSNRQAQMTGPQKKKKKKVKPTGLQKKKKKKMATKRKRGLSSDTPAKRRRLDDQ
ncbi:uncharacterized protein [Pagrus major]|uniref:uncharacterized protein n=1 Tax=Pagrus major TaxID=143350 RepID=UPI003CC8BB62